MAVCEWGGCEIKVINNKYAGLIQKGVKDEKSERQYRNHLVQYNFLGLECLKCLC